MKKITDFIVEKRYILLITFSLLAVVSLLVSNKVNINYDMAKYLPDTSDTRKGLDIMESEFVSDTSTLNIMLQDLSEEEQESAYSYLESLANVSNITTDEKDNYTLYTLTIDAKEDAKETKEVYDAVTSHFKDSLVDTSGNATNHNKTVLPFYIIALAVGCATVILIIMSESYIEPFLFLITIFIAVLLNKGTNLIFPSVSNITNSIAAILQMALSMDYSIMLMNRYRQEREKTKDKVEAMKNALSHAFQSISSSSVTTIVGLLALVFMSFTIGKDLGIVLAKGVLLSLVSIFTCLPGLIILCDKLIQKTSKKCPIFKLDFLGKISYKCRHFASILFVLAFVISYFLKGNLGIVYTTSGTDEIDKVFNLNNQMAIIYPNSEEEKIADYCRNLKDNENIDEILCYGNTINESLTYDELNPKLKDLGKDYSLEDYLIKIVYYNYYNENTDLKVSLNELIKFIKSDVYSNTEMSSHIDSEMRNDIAKLENFVNPDLIDKTHTAQEIATMLNIEESKVNDLLIYYHSKHLNTTITINEFINFLNKSILPNNQYNSSFTNETKQNISLLTTFTDQNLITKPLKAQELSQLFGLPESQIQKILILINSQTESPLELSISEFVNQIIYIKQYTNYLDDTDTSRIEAIVTNDLLMQLPTKYKSSALASLANVDPSSINYLYTLISAVNGEVFTISPQDLVSYLLNNPNLLNQEMQSKLTLLNEVMNLTISQKSMTYQEISKLLNLPSDSTSLIYSLYDTIVKSYQDKLSYKTFISFLINDVTKNPTYNKSIDQDSTKRLTTVFNLIHEAENKTTYTSNSTYEKLSPLASNLDKNLIELVYIYYGSTKSYNPEYSLTLEEFVNYLNQDILNDSRFTDFIDNQRREDIISSKDIISDAKKLLIGEQYSRLVINTKLTPEGNETFNFIQDLTNTLKENDIEGYIAGDSPMAYEMSKTFQGELNLITILTMIFIFVVVVITFKSAIIPIILVLLIQCAVFLTMGILSFGGSVYFISILIVQSILMGATIDYAILYTSYYEEARKTLGVKESIINAYNNSIHTILTSASILIIVTLIVGYFSSAITAKICMTISEGSICSSILILLLLPAVLASCDKFIIKKKQ